MSAEVYFAQRRATQGGGLLEKLEQLCDAAGFGALAGEGQALALKVGFPAPGNTTHLRPAYMARLVERLRQQGLQPFLTDTVPFGPMPGPGGPALLLAAQRQGFAPPLVEAPLVLADGPFGLDEVALPAGEALGQAAIASAIARAEGLLTVSHFTGHPHFGYAGALFHLGLGAASLSGKRRIWSGADEPFPARPDLAATANRMVESAAAIVARSRRVGFINVMVDLTPDPDTQAWSDAAIAPDIGILASRDPVALDQACIDMLNQAPGLASSRLGDAHAPDKLRALYPHADWEHALAYAERIGLGTRDYELMII